jgi:hypothetical protein
MRFKHIAVNKIKRGLWKAFRAEHFVVTIAQFARICELSNNTVYKYWQAIEGVDYVMTDFANFKVTALMLDGVKQIKLEIDRGDGNGW